ncbi:hypothetical protein DPMN_018638 [Dreissena polymorpha]|uniref:Uncharacterized protein n=1 Tax=Dreissena polymorpha TaxID=45954 RepID=A0A9D4S7H2_DREPO|nr:hypothetical protein DPMN_018638 [Dreissena polymorpha]
MAQQRPTWLVMGSCIVEIDRIVIREVQYQLEVNRLKGNFGWVWPMWVGRPRVGNGAMHINRCRNEEVIVKGNFGWVWPMWVGRLRVGNGAMHIEIDRIVIREFQFQFEVNQCRNEEIIVKGNLAWLWSMWAGRPRVVNGAMQLVEIDRIVKREVQYQFEFQGSNIGQDGQTDGRWR